MAIGEIGLSGELRRVPGVERRLAEAARLGFPVALVPPGCGGRVGALRAVEVTTVANALEVLGLRKKIEPERPHLSVVG